MTVPSEYPAHLYIHASSPDHFDHWLTHFVVEVWQKDGKHIRRFVAFCAM